MAARHEQRPQPESRDGEQEGEDDHRLQRVEREGQGVHLRRVAARIAGVTAGVRRVEGTGARAEWLRSLEHRFGRFAPPLVGLLLLLVATELIDGFRVLGAGWIGGDFLFHQALANEILLGVWPAEGPYAGLPSWYPPGFHMLLATTMLVTGLGAVQANQLLTLLWLPVLPIGTFVLARAVTGRSWVALLAALLTVFAGAYDLRAGRLWVNSLFMAGHEAYPLYPRDIVFGLLPFAVLAAIRGCDARRALDAGVWGATAGLLFGAAALVQPQLLLPLPVAIATYMLVAAVRRPDARPKILVFTIVAAAVVAAMFGPWLVSQLDLMRRNGGMGIDLSDAAEPAAYGFWNYPREFGLLLPLAFAGAATCLLFLRRSAADNEPWRPRPADAGIVLVAWFAAAFALGALYPDSWPLADGLRPQRMWLLASQPGTILAAIGLVALAEIVVGVKLRRPRLVLPIVLAVVLAVTVPTTFATARLVASTWSTPTYAHLDLTADRVPNFTSLFEGARVGRQTVLTYEDWSSLVWYETGQAVVATVPPGYAKLGYDPATFTGRSQDTRRTDVLRAFTGDPAGIAQVADEYGARFAVVGVGDGQLRLIDLAAALGVRSGANRVVEGNGWDGVELQPGATIAFTVAARGFVSLTVKVVATPTSPSTVPRRLSIMAVASDGATRGAVNLELPPSTRTIDVVGGGMSLSPGDRLVLTARDPVTIQSIAGVLAADSELPGWRQVASTPEAVMLERTP
jgi:hypothetical protein